MSQDNRPVQATIFGCAGPVLSAEEAAFFARANPLGFILFKRNCLDARQVAALTSDLRAAVGRTDAPVMIDEEGGRVQRLGPPAWPDFPAAEQYGRLAEQQPDMAVDLARRASEAQAVQLLAIGIDADATPVLDLRVPGATWVIGERAWSEDPARVARFGGAVIEGMMRRGVMPIIKHLPGHGRASVDSHVGLPVIDVPLATLRATDFVPFRALKTCPWGMAGHVLLPAIDGEAPASCSAAVIERVIRGEIGFDGLLLTDDLSMGALKGSVGDRAAAALAAGCDIALHCNGVMAEMVQVAGAAGRLSDMAIHRLAAGRQALADAIDPAAPALDPAQEIAAIDVLLPRKIGTPPRSV